MDGALTVVIGIGGAIIGSFLTWAFNYLSELQKAILQREHTKFSTFHAKQIDVLAEIYKQLSQVVLTIEEMIKLVPPG
ncbi:hypothetical protein OB13_18800, partial [Pontibacter sp. HJ8]